MNEKATNTEYSTSTSEAVATREEGTVSIQKPLIHQVGMFAGPCIFGVIYLAVVIFLIILFYRLVRATEKIAAKLEGGISVKKEEAP